MVDLLTCLRAYLLALVAFWQCLTSCEVDCRRGLVARHVHERVCAPLFCLQVAPEVSEEKIDAMVAELDARKTNRATYSRRRAFHPDKDVDFINDRNAHFNRKIARAFDAHTQEIKANLERGTALPEH